MFRIKICGVTTLADALAAADAGADAIGLNFHPGSSRFVSRDQAAEIAAALPSGIQKVGVFVNPTADDVRHTVERLSLDLVQLHGDEPPEFLARLGEIPVLRAFRLEAGGLPAVSDYLAECRQRDATPAMVLLDAFRVGAYGGTGLSLDWTVAAAYHQFSAAPPLVLAGGLAAANVAQAIAAVRPAAVDTASGVEASPGRKDHAQVAAFVAAAKKALGLGDRR
ncbi:MAG TPA: phosphoribosylanthranilate isomerase [Pirellulales bacterium]|nr:phosphoribosylanthranilate isomerase [Pirellulales bacterium]